MNIKKIDFTDIENLVNPLNDGGFASNFEIKITKTGMFNAFVGSFDTKLADNVLLDTSPVSPQTHWKQSLFFIDNPIEVSEGEIIEGTIKVDADSDNYRNLIIKFTYKVEGKGGSQAEEYFTFE
jgi:protein arginine N-methyltransferase 3